MQFKKSYRVIETDVDYLATPRGALRFSHVIKPDGLEKDDNGDIYAINGSFIDAEGKVTKPTVQSEQNKVTFESAPIGLLFGTIKLTNGDADGSILYQGTVRGDYLALGDEVEYKPEIGKALHEILPGINFIDANAELIHGPVSASGSAAAATTVDLSKATGTLAVEHGGTGGTDTQTARTNLEVDSKTNTDQYGTKISALETKTQDLEFPLPVAKGGTGATDAEGAKTNLEIS